MRLIFNNGDKLYCKERRELNNLLRDISSTFGLEPHEAHMLGHIAKNDTGHSVYGDDFKIEITPKNVNGDCILSIKDYDEYQKFEGKISIGFNKNELRQLIDLLLIAYNEM